MSRFASEKIGRVGRWRSEDTARNRFSGAGDPEKARGADHPDLAAGLNNLALLFKAKGSYAR